MRRSGPAVRPNIAHVARFDLIDLRPLLVVSRVIDPVA
jgi:hypothetical protein